MRPIVNSEGHKKSFLLISPQAWGKMFVSKHNYAVELAAIGHKVYFLEPPIISSSISRALQLHRLPEYGNLTLIRISIPPLINKARFHSRVLFEWYLQVFVFPKINAVDQIDEVWCFEGNIYSTLRWIKTKRKLLFLVDQHFGQNALNLAHECLAIASVTPVILQSLKCANKPQLLLNHGLARNFEELVSQSNWQSAQVRLNRNIKAGYVGNLLIGDVLDRDTLKQIISTNGGVDFHFWGSYLVSESNIGVNYNVEIKQFIDFLSSCQNVTLHGATSPKHLANEIQDIDVFLVVYNVGKDINQGSNSHKIIEYLSTGKVIVSSHISCYEEYPGLLEMMPGKSNEGMVQLFSKIVSAIDLYNRPEMCKQRIEFALDNTYGSQITRIDRFLSNVEQA